MKPCRSILACFGNLGIMNTKCYSLVFVLGAVLVGFQPVWPRHRSATRSKTMNLPMASGSMARITGMQAQQSQRILAKLVAFFWVGCWFCEPCRLYWCLNAQFVQFWSMQCAGQCVDVRSHAGLELVKLMSTKHAQCGATNILILTVQSYRLDVGFT